MQLPGVGMSETDPSLFPGIGPIALDDSQKGPGSIQANRALLYFSTLSVAS